MTETYAPPWHRRPFLALPCAAMKWRRREDRDRFAATYLALLVLLVLGAPAPAHGAQRARSTVFGVALGDPAAQPRAPLAVQLRGIAATGVGAVTLSFNWSKAQPSSGAAFDLTQSDRAVALASKQRLEVLPVVIQAPPWARVEPAETFSVPLDMLQYAAYLRAIVSRYGSTGSFWRDHRRLRRRPIRAWQVW